MGKLVVFGVTALLVVAVYGADRHHKVEKMFMSRTMSSDLAPSATGYIYRSDGNGPASLVHLGEGAVHQHLNAFPAPLQTHAGLSNYGYAPVAAAPAPTAKYYTAPAPKYYAAPAATSYSAYVPAAHLSANVGAIGKTSYANAAPLNKYASAEADASSDEGKSNDASDESDDESNAYDDDSDIKFDSGDAYGAGYAGKYDYAGDHHDTPNYAAEFDAAGYGQGDHGSYGLSDGHGGHGHGHSFSSGGGKKYGSHGHSSHGDKGDKGYKSNSHFDKGSSGKHFKDGHKGHYSDASGHKSGHSDDAHHYSQHHSGAKGYKGGDFKAEKGHKKGSKTTGFHNVYHKDEFKKDHEFYDDAHKHGHFNKHASGGSNHHSSEGGHKKGGKHDSAYHHDNFGKAGHSAKGHGHGSDKGYDSKGGHEGYYHNFNDYGKKGGESSGSEHGYVGKH